MMSLFQRKLPRVSPSTAPVCAMADPELDEKTTTERVFEAMDLYALKAIEDLHSEALHADTNLPVVSSEEKLKIFKAMQEWLEKSRKLRPPPPGGDEPAGIEAMRDLIRSEVKAAVKAPKRPPARAGRNGEGSELAKALGART